MKRKIDPEKTDPEFGHIYQWGESNPCMFIAPVQSSGANSIQTVNFSRTWEIDFSVIPKGIFWLWGGTRWVEIIDD